MERRAVASRSSTQNSSDHQDDSRDTMNTADDDHGNSAAAAAASTRHPQPLALVQSLLQQVLLILLLYSYLAVVVVFVLAQIAFVFAFVLAFWNIFLQKSFWSGPRTAQEHAMIWILVAVGSANIACFYILLQPSTPESFWLIQFSYRMDRLLRETTTSSTRSNTTTTNRSRGGRNQSVVVAAVGALAVCAVCMIPLGGTLWAMGFRKYRFHPCEAHISLGSTVPQDVQEFLLNPRTRSLPLDAESTQHGNVYQALDGTLYFTGSAPRGSSSSVSRKNTILYSYNPSNEPSPMQALDLYTDPKYFTTVPSTTQKDAFCFLAMSYHKPYYSASCLFGPDDMRNSKPLPGFFPTAETVVFGSANYLWIRESSVRFHAVDLQNGMRIKSFGTGNHQGSQHHAWWRCLLNHPFLAMMSLLVPITSAVAPYQMLWKRGVPSAGAMAWWFILALGQWMTGAWPPSWVLFLVVGGVTFRLLDQSRMVYYHRATLLWFLYGGIYPTLLVLDDPSVFLMGALLISATLLHHVPVILAWWIVLVLALQDMLVIDMGMNEGLAMMASVVGILGATHIVYEHGGRAMLVAGQWWNTHAVGQGNRHRNEEDIPNNTGEEDRQEEQGVSLSEVAVFLPDNHNDDGRRSDSQIQEP